MAAYITAAGEIWLREGAVYIDCEPFNDIACSKVEDYYDHANFSAVSLDVTCEGSRDDIEGGPEEPYCLQEVIETWNLSHSHSWTLTPYYSEGPAENEVFILLNLCSGEVFLRFGASSATGSGTGQMIGLESHGAECENYERGGDIPIVDVPYVTFPSAGSAEGKLGVAIKATDTDGVFEYGPPVTHLAGADENTPVYDVFSLTLADLPGSYDVNYGSEARPAQYTLTFE